MVTSTTSSTQLVTARRTPLGAPRRRQRREREDHKFCTVVYARLETGEDAAEGGAKITICRAGHAAPVLLRANGSTCKVGRHPRAIGVFDEAELTYQEDQLPPAML